MGAKNAKFPTANFVTRGILTRWSIAFISSKAAAKRARTAPSRMSKSPKTRESASISSKDTVRKDSNANCGMKERKRMKLTLNQLQQTHSMLFSRLNLTKKRNRSSSRKKFSKQKFKQAGERALLFQINRFSSCLVFSKCGRGWTRLTPSLKLWKSRTHRQKNVKRRTKSAAATYRIRKLSKTA